MECTFTHENWGCGQDMRKAEGTSLPENPPILTDFWQEIKSDL